MQKNLQTLPCPVAHFAQPSAICIATIGQGIPIMKIGSFNSEAEYQAWFNSMDSKVSQYVKARNSGLAWLAVSLALSIVSLILAIAIL